MTLKRLRTLAKKWIVALRLTDWDIDFKLVPDTEELGKCAGTCVWQTEYKTATIEIAGDQPPGEIEETLIHELLHLALEGHKPLTQNYKYDAMYERGLNVISEAMAAKGRKRENGTK